MLPYGAIMATAGAAASAGRCGLQALVLPLLALAVAQALWVPTAGAWRHRRGFVAECVARCAIRRPREHTGIHTVPLGLAVIAGGVATLAADGAGRWAATLAWTCLGLSWLFTLLCVGRFAWALARRRAALWAVDGAWFLVPAALLGAGLAADAAGRLEAGNPATMLRTLALAAVVLGWFGYWAIAAAALLRIRRYGFRGVPQAPWWIGMGCAGLAAAALGTTLQGSSSHVWLQASLTDAMVATVIVAIILCVPVLAGSAAFLVYRCSYRARAAWPPTFSTAVFALGCLKSGEVLDSDPLRWLGLGAGYATLLFWAITIAWNTRCTCVARFEHR
ncbi:MAG TPA: hypothetical protein VF265_08500 [Nevskiaceae bacterium]